MALDNERENVDRIIKDAYPDYPRFTRGGSRAKDTMIREDYAHSGLSNGASDSYKVRWSMTYWTKAVATVLLEIDATKSQ
ncbi:MAG TPA: hypothetical protein VK577_10235 [Bradyrhizobium sp.]|nr:hypothetical protein [Bradyrhizobium sp.]